MKPITFDHRTFNYDPKTQTDREQLCMNLALLCDGDNNMTNAVILEYVSLLNDHRLDDMLEFTTKEVRANV